MVWKRLIVIFAVLAILSAAPITASAAEVYTEGNISTTYVTYFRDILAKVPITDDYVFFRSGSNEYTMVVGDIFFQSGVAYCSGYSTVYTIYSYSVNYNTTYHFSTTTANGYTVTVKDALVYSNLEGYPDLYERGDYLETCILLLVLVIIVMYLVSRIFNFCLRTHRS